MLKWLRTGAWPKFTDIIAAIRQELQSVQPIDTASIRWEKDAEGMRAYYTGRTGGGEGLTVDEGVVDEDNCTGIVDVCFDAEEGTLSAFRPVVLTGIVAGDVNSFKYDTVFTCQKLDASSDRKAVIGILQEDLEAGEVGKCVIYGMTIAYVYFAYEAHTAFRTARFAYSDSYPLVADSSGSIQIISSRSGSYSYGNNLCAVNLSADSSEAYFGEFKVELLGDGLCIFNGSNPNLDVAGTIHAKLPLPFPKTDLAMVDGDIYVVLEWTGNEGIYQHPVWAMHVHQGSIETSPWVDNLRAAHWLIATNDNGRIIQHHKTGSIYVTGRWL